MLGHAKASMTLDTYADLFDEDLDGVADRLDAAIRTTATSCGLSGSGRVRAASANGTIHLAVLAWS